MCAPVLAVAAGLQAAGHVIGGVSAARTASANASALEQQAALRLAKADYDIEQATRRYRRQVGAKQAAIGASGITAASFSDVMADDAAEAALERQAIRWGATNDANNLRAKARNVKAQGRSALIGSLFSAAGSLAGSYGRAASAGMSGGTVVEAESGI